MFAEDKKRIIFIIIEGILCLSGVISTKNYLNRGLWFDEVLTVLEFSAYPKSLIEVYRNYVIPNNHILYSAFLKIWLYPASFFYYSNPILRLPSLIAGLSFVLIAFFLWKKEINESALFISLLAFTLSPIFTIYATAIRGYIFSILSISLAISALLFCEKRKYAYPLYCLFSFISVGIMPNNVLALFVSSFIPIIIRRQIFSFKFFLKYSLLPFACLVLFYLPIFPQFLKVISIKEGWNSKISALFSFYISLFFIFLIPFLSMFFSIFTHKISKREAIIYIFIFFIPAFFFIIRIPAPFPRTFLCFIPVWIFLFSLDLHKLFQYLITKKSVVFTKIIFMILSIATIINALVISLNKSDFSRIIFADEQDDFFSPYFMDSTFNPDDAIKNLITLTDKKTGIVFAEMAADHQSLLFSAIRMGMSENFILFDTPKKKIERFPLHNEDDKVFIIASSRENALKISRRFHLSENLEIKYDSPKQKIFEVKIR